MASLADGREILLRNIALEAAPAILIDYLRQATNRTVIVEGRTVYIAPTETVRHRQSDMVLPPDIAVASTYIGALIAAGAGEVSLRGLIKSSLPKRLRSTYETMGVRLNERDSRVLVAAVRAGQVVIPRKVHCEVWPGFPTDSAPMFAASIAGHLGSSEIIDTIYDKRSSHVPGLNAMGYEMKAEGNKTTVYGHAPRQLGNVAVEAMDIRCGAALMVGAIGSNTESVKVSNYHQIYRGYADLVGGLRRLGVAIEEA